MSKLKKFKPNSPRRNRTNPQVAIVVESAAAELPPATLTASQRSDELHFFKDTKPLPRWCWSTGQENGGLYISYQKNTSDEIEKSYHLYLTANGESVIKVGLILVDFNKMKSVVVKGYSGKEKKLVRGTWFFFSEGGSYMAFEEDVALKLEALLLQGQFDEIEVSEKPLMVVKYIGNGQFKQYRHSKNGKRSECGYVTRGWMGFMMKDGKELQFQISKKSSSLENSNLLIQLNHSPRASNFEELLRSGLKNFNHEEIVRENPAIARGSYGIVYKGKVKALGEKIVVIKDMFIKDNKSIDEWARELETMQKAKSSYVAEVFGFTSVENNLIIVMEYFPNGDLFNLLHKKKIPLDTLRRIIMARQILCGLLHLHQHHVLHRDIKSMNILVTEVFDCKITDFGMSKLITDDLEIFNTANAGTPLWMAPEVKAGVYGFPADVYSAGLVLYEILEEKLPPWDKSIEKILIPDDFYFQKVIRPLIGLEPSERKTAKEALKVFDKQLMDGVVGKIVKKFPDAAPKTEIISYDDGYLQKLYQAISSKNPDYNEFIYS